MAKLAIGPTLGTLRSGKTVSKDDVLPVTDIGRPENELIPSACKPRRAALPNSPTSG